MKTIYIIRHWKSSWKNILLKDFDRPLSERWKKDIFLIWKKLKQKNICPDKIISSPSKRTRQTCKYICDLIWYSFSKVKFEQKIYDYHNSTIDFYLWYILDLKNKYDEVFLIGHNYVFTELAQFFVWKDFWNIPTSWIVCIKFNINNWKEILEKNWKLDFFIYPKLYK